jgi:hypothetical protein
MRNDNHTLPGFAISLTTVGIARTRVCIHPSLAKLNFGTGLITKRSGMRGIESNMCKHLPINNLHCRAATRHKRESGKPYVAPAKQPVL